MYNSLKYDEFLIHWNQYHRQHPDFRLGQSMFNSLVEFDKDLAEEIRASDKDPYYISNTELEFVLDYLKERWR